MKPGSMMMLGAACALTGFVVYLVRGVDASMLIFAGGALFGKGYGVWEASNR